MDDSALAVTVCLLPFGAVFAVVALIVWLVRSGSRAGLAQRVSELEQQNRALLHRLVQLEGWAHSVASTL